MTTLKGYLRGDVIPTETQITEAKQPNVTIFAPTWVRDALAQLQKHLQGKTFEIVTSGTPSMPDGQFQLAGEISLKQLQMISRNETDNVTGEIEFKNYDSIPQKVIYSLKDLTRQSVIVGRTTANKYGGYPRRNGHPITKLSNPVPAYIIDLIGLQFQQPYNSGRLVLSNKSLPTGSLDNFIFKQVVGEEKLDFDTVHKLARSDSRYVKVRDMPGHSGPGPTYFDTRAYQQFVKRDVILTGQALLETASENQDSGINFKFLKYGTGFFAPEHYKEVLNKNILSGVVEGLEVVLEKDSGQIIKQVEFTHYSPIGDSEARKKLDELKERFKVEVKFTDRDALQPDGTLITATTNCGDPHAPFGNEMEYESVDAAIAENLEFKGLPFIPALNTLMKEKYICLLL